MREQIRCRGFNVGWTMNGKKTNEHVSGTPTTEGKEVKGGGAGKDEWRQVQATRT